MHRPVRSAIHRPERPVVREQSAASPSASSPRGLHLDLAEAVAGEACDRARRVGFRPGSAQMAGLQRAERVLLLLTSSG